MTDNDVKWWQGINQSTGKREVFRCDDASRVTPENFPSFGYATGPFKTKAEAEAYIDKSGWFADPFCNNGAGR